MSSLLYLFWFLFQYQLHATVTYLDCESFLTEPECNSYLTEGCYWQHHIYECISINCWTFTSHQDCLLWQTQYHCYWQNIQNYLYYSSNNINNICYEYCPKLIDIVFIININSPNNAEIALNYTQSIISIFNKTYPTNNNNNFGLILFSYHVQEIFDLNTGWNVNEYLNILNNIFDSEGRYSLLFNNDISSDSDALKSAYNMFKKSKRSTINPKDYRKLAIYISSQGMLSVPEICNISKQYEYNTNDIELYGAQIGYGPTFNCYGDGYKYISHAAIATYNTLYNDINYLLSSICPHTLTPTISPTYSPTNYPTLSPTNRYKQILITNKTCIDSSLRQSYRFNIPRNGVVSGIIFNYISGWRKEDLSLNTIASYWGSAKYHQFSLIVLNLANNLPIYPVIGNTRNIQDCNQKYDNKNYPDLLNNYYCLTNNNLTSVNDTIFKLYSPRYNVNINDQWSVFYADDIYSAFHVNTQKIGNVCFGINLLYEYIDTGTPSTAPTTSIPTNKPSLATTLLPGNPTSAPSEPTTSNPTTSNPTTSEPSTSKPSKYPSLSPTFNPSLPPITPAPTLIPTLNPTIQPVALTPFEIPTQHPSTNPTGTPSTHIPTSISSTNIPTNMPINKATFNPTNSPTNIPSANPTVKTLPIDCCEFISNVTYSAIHATPNELDKINNYSQYLSDNINICLSSNKCGYYSYSNYLINSYNKCEYYWLYILMFYEKYKIPMDAYYTYHDICYLCNNYKVSYFEDDTNENGFCFPPQIVETNQPTTLSPIASNPKTKSPTTLSPTINPVNPTVFPTNTPLTLSPTIYDLIDQTESNIITTYNPTNQTNNIILCSDNVSIECVNDNTLATCINIILFTVIFNVFIMFLISYYYKKYYLSKQPDVYDEGSTKEQSDGRSYLKHVSDDNMKIIKKNKNKNKNKSKNKGIRKKIKQKNDKKIKNKSKKKKKKHKNKRDNDNIKSKMLKSSDSDDVELQLVISSDE